MAREIVVVTKSTVPVGTAAKVADAVGTHARYPFHVVSNPEFLKEGAAVDDFMKPDRVVLGAETDHARSVMAELYAPFVRTGQADHLHGHRVGGDDQVRGERDAGDAHQLHERHRESLRARRRERRPGAEAASARDDRIGPAFLFPGPGVRRLVFSQGREGARADGARSSSSCLRILEAVEAVNDDQKHRLFEKLTQRLGAELTGARIAVWGLAFKPNTDDMREAPALTLIEAAARRRRHRRRARSGRDGRGEASARRSRASSRRRATRRSTGADALVVVTDWNEYRHPDFARIKETLRRPVVVDGRNLYSIEKMRALGFAYASIGRAVVA